MSMMKTKEILEKKQCSISNKYLNRIFLPVVVSLRAKSSKVLTSLSLGEWIIRITEPNIVNKQPIWPNVLNFSPKNRTDNKALIILN